MLWGREDSEGGAERKTKVCGGLFRHWTIINEVSWCGETGIGNLVSNELSD